MRWLAELDLAPPPAPQGPEGGGGKGQRNGAGGQGGAMGGRRAQAEGGRSRPQWGARGKAHRRGEGGGQEGRGAHLNCPSLPPPDVMDLVKPGRME